MNKTKILVRTGGVYPVDDFPSGWTRDSYLWTLGTTNAVHTASEHPIASLDLGNDDLAPVTWWQRLGSDLLDPSITSTYTTYCTAGNIIELETRLNAIGADTYEVHRTGDIVEVVCTSNSTVPYIYLTGGYVVVPYADYNSFDFVETLPATPNYVACGGMELGKVGMKNCMDYLGIGSWTIDDTTLPGYWIVYSDAPGSTYLQTTQYTDATYATSTGSKTYPFVPLLSDALANAAALSTYVLALPFSDTVQQTITSPVQTLTPGIEYTCTVDIKGGGAGFVYIYFGTVLVGTIDMSLGDDTYTFTGTPDGDTIRIVSDQKNQVTVDFVGIGTKAETHWLETYDTVPFPIVIQAADIREVNNRHDSHTKTITLPGTKDNNVVFGNIFLSTSDREFDIRRKADCEVYEDGIVVLEGFLQLTKVSYVGDTKEYECVIYGKSVDLFDKLGELLLDDLNLSAYSHVRSQANVSNSWTGNYASPGYYYPLIDWEGTLDYAVVSTAVGGIEIEKFTPCLYVKNIVDQIFKEAGFSYISSFFNSSTYESLILPQVGNMPQLPTNRNVTLSMYVAYTWQTNGDNFPHYSAPVDLTWGFGAIDVNGNFTAIPGTTTVTTNNLVSTYASLTITTDVTAQSEIVVVVYTSGLYSGYGPGLADATDPTIILYPGVFAGSWFSATYNDVDSIHPSGNFRASVSADLVSAQPGGYDNGVWMVPFDNDTTTPNYDTNGYFHVGSQNLPDPYANYYALNYPTPDPIPDPGVHTVPFTPVSSLVPLNIKQTDLLLALIRMFNLYFEKVTGSDNILYIEPRDDYYDTSVVIRDWNARLDRSKPLTSQLMSELQSKQFHWSYTYDGDQLGTDYSELTERTYGDRTRITSNDFVDGVQEIEVPTGATVLSSLQNSGRFPLSIVSSSGNGSGSNLLPRIMFRKNLTLSPGQYWYFCKDTTLTVATLTSTLPYAGFLDDPYNPTKSLNFGPLVKEYWLPNSVTDNDLYKVYWKRSIDEIASADSALVVGEFNLHPTDVLNLRFNDKIILDGVYYVLNRIDYDASSSGTTKVELMKMFDIRFPLPLEDMTVIY